MSGLRAFLAVPLPERTRVAALRIVAPLRERARGVRWVPEESLHLTLKFLGEIEAAKTPILLRQARAKLARSDPFEATLGGLGAFPNASSARVIWLDVRDGGARLARMARVLDAAAARIGVPREHRPFRPHLTVGRLREPLAVPIGGLGLPEDLEPGSLSFPVENVVLYESRLSSTGARYVPLAHLSLGESGDEVDAPHDTLAPDY